MNSEKKLSQIIEGKLSSASSIASTTLSIEDCRDAVRLVSQSLPIDNQYLAPICDKEILSYPFLIQRSLMKDITCRVVARILDRRLKSDQEELKSLKEESDGQKSKGKDFIDSEIECTEDMIDQYDFDIERQKKVLRSWQKGNFSQYAEEIKAKVFKYKKGAIFQEEVEKELVRYITSLNDNNVQGIFKKFKDILPISREAKVGYTGHNTQNLSRGNSQQLKMLLHIHPESVIIHTLNIKVVNIIYKIVDKSIEISRELEEDVDHSTRKLNRKYSGWCEMIQSYMLSGMFTIITPLSFSYHMFVYTSALAITHIYNTYANSQCGGPIRKKVQDIAAELDTDYKNHLKEGIEESPNNKLKELEVQEIVDKNQIPLR